MRLSNIIDLGQQYVIQGIVIAIILSLLLFLDISLGTK